MRKKLQDLTIKDAFMFAAVMSDAEQCRHLLELVLEMKGCRAVSPPVRIGTGNENSGSKCCG